MKAETVINTIEDLIFSFFRNPDRDKVQTLNSIRYFTVKLMKEYTEQSEDPDHTDKVIRDLLQYLLALVEIERIRSVNEREDVISDMLQTIHVPRSKHFFNIEEKPN